MSKSVRSYYKFHYRELLDFRYRLYLLTKEKNLRKRAKIACNLLAKASAYGLGIYSSMELEKPFLDLAKTITTKKNIQYEHDSFLHVMTTAYQTGGHTRVVERWIDISPLNQKHSIILLNQGDSICPKKIYDITQEHSGSLIILNEKNIVTRAEKLREIAQSYEYIVLHIHMDDPTAIIAFGTNEFTRPVILFNHADHTFWCGISIADMIADIRDNNFTLKNRGGQNSFTIRIPFESNPLIQNYPKSQKQSRIDLGLPLDKKIILTVGGKHKYVPFAGHEFCNTLSKIIMSKDDVVCYGIGPSPDIGEWNKYKRRFIALGEIAYGEQYFDYINACDIFVNSFPIGGATTMLDAMQFFKPVLSYSIFRDNLGDIICGIETNYDFNLFSKKLCDMLDSRTMRENIAQMQYKQVLQYHGIDVWYKNILEMLFRTPKNHKVNDLCNKMTRYKIDDLSVMISLWNRAIVKKRVSLKDIYHQIRILLHL